MHNYDDVDNLLCHNCSNSIIYKPPKGRQIGEKHWHWKGGVEYKGEYKLIYSPNHPRAHRGKIYEHVLVMEKHLGRYLTDQERVHHKDHNKRNNDIKNLQLTSNQAEHASLHRKHRDHYEQCPRCKGSRTRKDGTIGNKQIWECSDCDRHFRTG